MYPSSWILGQTVCHNHTQYLWARPEATMTIQWKGLLGMNMITRITVLFVCQLGMQIQLKSTWSEDTVDSSSSDCTKKNSYILYANDLAPSCVRAIELSAADLWHQVPSSSSKRFGPGGHQRTELREHTPCIAGASAQTWGAPWGYNRAQYVQVKFSSRGLYKFILQAIALQQLWKDSSVIRVS
jgi:hypothetical protein